MVIAVSFSSDGKHIVSGSRDGTIKIWSVKTGKCIKSLYGHTASVDIVSFGLNDKYIFSFLPEDNL